MNRKEFLIGIGGASVASLLQYNQMLANDTKNKNKAQSGDCILIPMETAGPFPLDLSNNSEYFRQDIREDKSGTVINLKMKVVNIDDDCKPIPNARIDIWHCDKDGYYSGFSNNGYLGTQNNFGKTFCRGIQLTDENGEADFITLYPGWYPGRVTHFHFQVFLNSSLSATSQIAFPEEINTQVYNTPLYSQHGQNPTKNTNDGVFNDSQNTQYQMLTIVENLNGEFDAEFTVGIAGGISNINFEKDNGGQFEIKNISPNPLHSKANLELQLNSNGILKIELFDINGIKVNEIANISSDAGSFNFPIEIENLSNGKYIIQISFTNEYGTFRQCKLITKIK